MQEENHFDGNLAQFKPLGDLTISSGGQYIGIRQESNSGKDIAARR